MPTDKLNRDQKFVEHKIKEGWQDCPECGKVTKTEQLVAMLGTTGGKMLCPDCRADYLAKHPAYVDPPSLDVEGIRAYKARLQADLAAHPVIVEPKGGDNLTPPLTAGRDLDAISTWEPKP